MPSTTARSDSEFPPPAKSCFVIGPIGPAGSEIRRRSDQILRHIVRAALEPLGYKAVRADEIDQSGSITAQIITRITDDDLVVADLTDLNPNVLYELALRHALRKPFVHLAAEGQRLPFDVAELRTIFVDHRDLDSAAGARQALVNCVRAIEEDEALVTPISLAMELKDLRGSGNPEQEATAQILEHLQQVRKEIGRQVDAGVRLDDYLVLRNFIEHLASHGRLDGRDAEMLVSRTTSDRHDRWVNSISTTNSLLDDPWASAAPARPVATFDEEPPF